MKITPKILHIPPYISTSWQHVMALHQDKSNENSMIVTLVNGSEVEVPNLSAETISSLFKTFEQFLHDYEEKQIQMQIPPLQAAKEAPIPTHFFHIKAEEAPFDPLDPTTNPPTSLPISFEKIEGLPKGFQKGMSMGHIHMMNQAMQHDMNQANAPDIPHDVLKKIAGITKIVAGDDLSHMPKPEPHCNCPHCQISRAIHGMNTQLDETAVNPATTTPEEVVDDKELSFQQWNITEENEQLFIVKNKLDPFESYNVFLGDPVGCTCGRAGCEHLLAVLNS